MKLKPSTFVRAAELIAASKENYACRAIDRVEGNRSSTGDETSKARKLFSNIYNPDRAFLYFGNWFGSMATSDAEKIAEMRQVRIFALLFAAEIAKGGGL